MDGRRESLARSVRVMLMIVIAAGLMLAGCSSGPKAMTEQVAVAAQGGVDKIAVNLDSRTTDAAVWANDGDQPIEITFLHGGPAPLTIEAHGKSRAVAVSEFGGRGNYPYHVRRSGTGQSMSSAADTTGGPDEPAVSVGP